MPNQLVPTELEELKLGFLESFKELRIPKDVCEKFDMKRTRLNGWLRHDEAFREEFLNVQKDIVDEVDRLFMKHSGILRWTKEEQSRGLHKWSNIRSLELIRKANTTIIESTVPPGMAALKINGLSTTELKALVTADKNGAEAATIVEAEIIPEGIPQKKPPHPAFADLVRKKKSKEADG